MCKKKGIIEETEKLEATHKVALALFLVDARNNLVHRLTSHHPPKPLHPIQPLPGNQFKLYSRFTITLTDNNPIQCR